MPETPSIPEPGRPNPLGATISEGGVNFSVYSANATGLELLLFNDADDSVPAFAIAFDPQRNRTHHYWHAYVPGLRAGQLYAFRGLPRQLLRRGAVTWRGVELNQPDWSAPSHTLAATVRSVSGRQLSHVGLNAWSEPLSFALPSVTGGWRRWIDTSQEPPDDICEWGAAPRHPAQVYGVAPRSLVVLIASVYREAT